MNTVYITNVASFMPNEPVCNDEMEGILGMVCDKPSRARRTVLRSNGIETRYYAVDKQSGEATHTNAQLTSEAIRHLADDEFNLQEIDCLACGTSMGDQLLPNHGVMVHGELGTPPCEVIATSGVCVAGMTAMKYAYMAIASGEAKNAVATGSEIASTSMRGGNFEKEIESKTAELEKMPELAFEKDFLRWMLSDGAGAVLLKSEPRAKGLSLRIDWIFERSYANETQTCMYGGADKLEDGSIKGWMSYSQEEQQNRSIFTLKQDVKQLNEHVIHYTVERPLTEIQELKGLRPEDVDYFLPHYSSKFFRQKVYDGMKKVGFEVPFERWFTNISSKGNTGSASIYIILDELYRSGKLKAGEKLLCYIPESGRFSSAFMHLTVCEPGK